MMATRHTTPRPKAPKEKSEAVPTPDGDAKTPPGKIIQVTPGTATLAPPSPQPHAASDSLPSSLPPLSRQTAPHAAVRATTQIAPDTGDIYSGQYSPAELSLLSNLRPLSVLGEINLLRVGMLRVLALSRGVETLDGAMEVLTTLGDATGRLATLIRLQKSGNQNQDELLTACLSKAMDKLMQDRRAPDRRPPEQRTPERRTPERRTPSSRT